ncbi:cell division protein DedD [bacterium]|nr:cell division protein DedD [bacterium]
MKNKKIRKTVAKTSAHQRPPWDQYFLGIMEMVGSRATCDRGRSGCVIVKEKQILTTGYVGSPIGAEHCDDVGHEMHEVINDDGIVSKHCIRTVHAEQNAIAQAARLGVALTGSTMYCRMTPCYVCAKIIINAGIKRVVSLNDYHAGKKSKDIFKKCGVEFSLVNTEIEKYKNQ